MYSGSEGVEAAMSQYVYDFAIFFFSGARDGAVVRAALSCHQCGPGSNREKTIFDVLYSKQAFLDNENIGLKNPQNWHFFHGFGQKFKILLTFCFMLNTPRKSIWCRSR